MRSWRGGFFLCLVVASTWTQFVVGAPSPRAAMREFVVRLAEQARDDNPDFLIVPQNALELLTVDGTPEGAPAAGYLSALSGVGQEDLSYGYTGDDVPTPAEDHARLLAFLDLAEQKGLPAIAVDYCAVEAHARQALSLAREHGFAPYAAPSRNLEVIAADSLQPFQASTESVERLSEARNVLYLLNPERFTSRVEFVRALSETDYDLFVIDAWFGIEEPLSPADVAALQRKPGGGRRLVLAYLSIGEAENYRNDWNPTWAWRPPAWLGQENPDWPGNFAVEYRDPEWQAIVSARLDLLVEAGFDGAYLDKVDAYETFESSA